MEEVLGIPGSTVGGGAEVKAERLGFHQAMEISSPLADSGMREGLQKQMSGGAHGMGHSPSHTSNVAYASVVSVSG